MSDPHFVSHFVSVVAAALVINYIDEAVVFSVHLKCKLVTLSSMFYTGSSFISSS